MRALAATNASRAARFAQVVAGVACPPWPRTKLVPSRRPHRPQKRQVLVPARGREERLPRLLRARPCLLLRWPRRARSCVQGREVANLLSTRAMAIARTTSVNGSELGAIVVASGIAINANTVIAVRRPASTRAANAFAPSGDTATSRAPSSESPSDVAMKESPATAIPTLTRPKSSSVRMRASATAAPNRTILFTASPADSAVIERQGRPLLDSGLATLSLSRLAPGLSTCDPVEVKALEPRGVVASLDRAATRILCSWIYRNLSCILHSVPKRSIKERVVVDPPVAIDASPRDRSGSRISVDVLDFVQHRFSPVLDPSPGDPRSHRSKVGSLALERLGHVIRTHHVQEAAIIKAHRFSVCLMLKEPPEHQKRFSKRSHLARDRHRVR